MTSQKTQASKGAHRNLCAISTARAARFEEHSSHPGLRPARAAIWAAIRAGFTAAAAAAAAIWATCAACVWAICVWAICVACIGVICVACVAACVAMAAAVEATESS